MKRNIVRREGATTVNEAFVTPERYQEIHKDIFELVGRKVGFCSIIETIATWEDYTDNDWATFLLQMGELNYQCMEIEAMKEHAPHCRGVNRETRRNGLFRRK